MKIHYLFCVFIIILISGCASLQIEDNWPNDIPPLSYFENYYAQDKAHQKVCTKAQYLTWIKRFYYGSFIYSRGWKQATDETLASLPPEENKEQIAYQMSVIGDLIAPEWAKNPSYRVIHTRHIVIWGDALTRSAENNQQRAIINQVHIDVIDLLAGRLQDEDIRKERYGVADDVQDDESLFEKSQV